MNALAVLVPVGLVSAVLYFGNPDITKPPPPTPKPPPAPQCQQNGNEKIAARLLLAREGDHYTHVVKNGSNTMPLISDGVFAANSFEDTGPVVFRRDGERFAFIGVSGGATYILEYTSGALYPNIAERIDGVPEDKWVCYSPSGKYLVTLARQNKTWFLFVHDRDMPPDANPQFKKIPLAAKPSHLELEPANGNGQEGFRYEIDLGDMKQEIRSRFKNN
jgi:hypothetical protein